MTTFLNVEELLTAKSHRFFVDGLRYDMGLSPGGKLWFALTGGASPAFAPTYDLFDWDAEPFIVEDLGVLRCPVTVVRKVEQTLYSWLGSYRPHYFTYRAESPRRQRLYRRYANRICQRFPYQFFEYRNDFHFYWTKIT